MVTEEKIKRKKQEEGRREKMVWYRGKQEVLRGTLGECLHHQGRQGRRRESYAQLARLREDKELTKDSVQRVSHIHCVHLRG